MWMMDFVDSGLFSTSPYVAAVASGGGPIGNHYGGCWEKLMFLLLIMFTRKEGGESKRVFPSFHNF